MSGMERLGLAAGLMVVYALFCLWCARRHQRHFGADASDTHARDTHANDTLVAYASQTGGAIELANRTVKALKGQARLLPLNQVDDKVLSATKRALIVASTYGQGEPPDNAARFAQRYLVGRSVGNGRGIDLSHLEFAILALGDSSYPDFCHFGHAIRQRLSERGAISLYDVVEVDAQQPDASERAVAQWHAQLRHFGGEVDPVEDLAATPCHRLTSWQLAERVLLNPGSPGAPLFYLQFVGAVVDGSGVDGSVGTSHNWQPGDIVETVPPGPTGSDSQGCRIAPRKYSIASIATDGTLDLVVRQQRDEHGQLGLASGWLTHDLTVGEKVDFRLCDNALFRSPALETPLILIGNGSGFAGLRAHLRHRQRCGDGRNWLLFGERDPQADRLFTREINEWQHTGHLEALDLAFSRCTDRPMYVQDCLYAREAQVEDWVNAGAVIMVCGSREGMAQGVERALEDILGRDMLDELEADGRYRRDIY